MLLAQIKANLSSGDEFSSDDELSSAEETQEAESESEGHKELRQSKDDNGADGDGKHYLLSSTLVD